MNRFRRQVGRLIRRRHPISRVQLAMRRVRVNLSRVSYLVHPDPLLDFIVPVETYVEISECMEKGRIHILSLGESR